MKRMRRIVIVMLSLVFLGVTTCESVGYAKEESYINNIYEKEGYSYLDITLETEDTVYKDKEPLDIVEFKAYLGEKYTSSVTHDTLHPTKGSDTAFLNDIDKIIGYQTLVSEYEDLKAREGGNAVEQEVLKELQEEKYKELVVLQGKYKSTICKVPKDLTILLTTREYIDTSKATEDSAKATKPNWVKKLKGIGKLCILGLSFLAIGWCMYTKEED